MSVAIRDGNVDGSDEQAALEALSRATGFSAAAIASMRSSIERGGGRMAQFDHAEFGGPGQWMRGGMLMIGDFTNDDLKRRVGALCDALADRLDHDGASPEGRDPVAGADHESADASWYPASLGHPAASGRQDGMRYAWFSTSRRLAIDDGHRVTIRDTGDHRIDGVAQQQGGGSALTFTSQHGPLDVERLPIVEDPAGTSTPIRRATSDEAPVPDAASRHGTTDPFVALEKLADLHARGIVDRDAFEAKKAELLKRI